VDAREMNWATGAEVDLVAERSPWLGHSPVETQVDGPEGAPVPDLVVQLHDAISNRDEELEAERNAGQGQERPRAEARSEGLAKERNGQERYGEERAQR